MHISTASWCTSALPPSQCTSAQLCAPELLWAFCWPVLPLGLWAQKVLAWPPARSLCALERSLDVVKQRILFTPNCEPSGFTNSFLSLCRVECSLQKQNVCFPMVRAQGGPRSWLPHPLCSGMPSAILGPRAGTATIMCSVRCQQRGEHWLIAIWEICRVLDRQGLFLPAAL